MLHDISHTAFSHVIDFALNNKNENYHEMIYDEVISNSQIPKILKKNGYSYKDILEDETKWTILEKDAPKLCADRIDYILRDMYRYGYTNKSEIDLFTSELYVVNGEIVVKSVDRAKWFLDLYYKEVVDFFMEPINVYSYNKLSKSIKIAMENNELTMEDILKAYEEVMNILKNSNDNRIIKLIDSLNSNVNLRINEEKYDIHIKGKVRLIDLSIYINYKVLALSEVDANIKQINENAMNKIKKGVYIEIL